MKSEQQITRNAIIIRMNEQGYSQEAIGKAVNLSQGRVSQLLKGFQNNPNDFYSCKYRGKSPKLTIEEEERLKAILEEGAEACGFSGNVWTSGRIQRVIRERFGVSYHRHHLPKYMKRLGFSLQKPRLRDCRQSQVKVKEWVEERLPALKKSPPGTPENLLR